MRVDEGSSRIYRRELDEGEATALAASRFAPAESPAFASAWPDATWMATGAGLPQVISDITSLLDFRLRLQ